MNAPEEPAVSAAAESPEAPESWATRFTHHHVTILVAILALLSSIAFYFLQRGDAVSAQRKQNTMAMLALRYTDAIAEAKLGVNTYMKSQSDSYVKAFDARESGQKFDAVIPDETLDDFLTMTEYFDSVLVCRAAKSCDPEMTDQLFNGDLCSFAGNGELIGLPQLEKIYGKPLTARLRAYAKDNCP